MDSRELNLHHVNWGNVAIPGRVCRVRGMIKLRKGQARIGRSGYGPLQVLTFGPDHGPVTAWA